ncbi:uncharacterized protein LOC143216111 isoform X2 [Lasioglossum baleicum]|uniref:uncharacterized protein LOC143216111 isoform X2 n=1 Tax=Lasioglossum baleicum TaxID=434251 RepID=UPI003FCDF386
MAPGPRNAFAAKVSGSSTGKENQLHPATTTATTTVKKCKKLALRRHGSLSSNDERRAGLAGSTGRQGLAIAETLSSKKTSFQVHCDDKNELQLKHQPRARPRRGSAASSIPLASLRVQGHENIQPAAGIEETGDRTSRKRLPEDRSRKNENLLPSKIPRRVRSTSTGLVQQRSRSCYNENALPRRAISATRLSSRAVERTRAAKCAALTHRTYRVEPSERVVTPTTVQENRFRRTVDSNDLRPWLRKGHRRNDSPSTSASAHSPSTPACAHSPKTFAVDLCKTPEQQASVGASEARPTSIRAELFWNTAYHADLLIIEREKEEREPRLSTNFLREHVNADQRTLIVMFLLHLGTHNRYPSHIIYRAVKLFDAAIDKLQVSTVFIQLAALATMWIALKALGKYDDIPTATEMISLAKDLYAGREDLLIGYERKILRVLNFNVTFADVHSLFAYHLINCRYSADLSEGRFAFVYRAGGYVIDVTLLDEKFCRMSASVVAITAAELVLGLIVDTELACAAGRTTDVQPRWLYWRGLLCGAGATVGSRFTYRLVPARSRVCLKPALFLSYWKRKRRCCDDGEQVSGRGDRPMPSHDAALHSTVWGAEHQIHGGVEKVQSQQIRSDSHTSSRASRHADVPRVDRILKRIALEDSRSRCLLQIYCFYSFLHNFNE